MNKVTKLDAMEAIRRANDMNDIVYMVKRIGPDTTVAELMTAEAFLRFESAEEPSQEPETEPAADVSIEPAEEPVPKKKRGRKPKKTNRDGFLEQTKEESDIGKVHALRKAGWTVIMIADEMGMDEDQVREILETGGMS